MNHTKEEAMEFVDALYRKHYNNVLNMVRKDFTCASRAEDLAQDVFVEATRKAEKLLIHENPDGWIMETARNKMMNLRKNLYKRTAKEAGEAEVELLGMESDFGMVEMTDLMKNALNKHEIMLFYMYYFGGYTAKEMAEFEHITEVNFKVRMLRIRNKVKEALKGKGKE